MQLPLLNAPSWETALKPALTADYFDTLTERINDAYTTSSCYPPLPLIWTALERCPLYEVRVVIVGQDPYHGADQAHGLAFSVTRGTPIPPSLRNIFKEMRTDVGGTIPNHGDLTHLAEQGVLLLNTTLTVQAGAPGSHRDFGWETFTDTIITTISRECDSVIFLLWGAPAQKKAALIDDHKHLVLTAPHPSPLSAYRGFFGSHHFSQANAYLTNHGRTNITWLTSTPDDSPHTQSQMLLRTK